MKVICFFLFVTGAGDYDQYSDGNNSTFFTSDDYLISQINLESLLKPIKEKEAVINLVFGQSHSGGFVEQFSKDGYVVVSACTKDENVHISPEAPYLEFLYRWTSAIAGYKLAPGSDGNPIQIPVNADADNDGYVSMEEAFNYAKSNDKFLNNAEHRETPQYFSSPNNLGKILAFNRVPTECDLYVRDNEEDCGAEPNTSTTKYWDSPDIWVRNSNDNGSTHQNPEYSSDHTKAYIKVRVHNNENKNYLAGKWLHISWAQPATTYHPAVWDGQSESSMPTSGKLAAIPIGSIPARSERIVTGEWDLPAYLLDNTSFFSKNSFCIFAEITDSPDDSSATRWERLQILASNNAAQKNTTVIKQNEVLDFVNLLVRNNTQQQGNYSIEVLPREESDADFYTKGFVEISIPNDTYTSLSNNGLQIYNGSSYLSGNATVCQFGSPTSSLSHVLLKPGEAKEVQIRFNFVVTPKESKTYRFDVIQRDASSQIVGGMTFEIESPCDQVLYPFSISSASDENGGMNLSVDNESFRHIEWRNVKNETIGTQESINVKPSANNDRFSVAGVTEEGELGMATISFEGAYGIEALTCENSGKLKVTLHEAVGSGCQLMVSSVSDGQKMFAEPIEAGAEEATLDISALAPGLYAVSLVKEGEVTDTKCFSNK